MAEFSKEWCDVYDPEGIKPDFSIEGVAKLLEDGWCVYGYVCEGFGICGIGKSDMGDTIVEFEDKWVDFETFKLSYANQKTQKGIKEDRPS